MSNELSTEEFTGVFDYDFWIEHDGKMYVDNDGIEMILYVNMYEAKYPTKRHVVIVSGKPTLKGKMTKKYKEIRDYLGDDWSTDVLSMDFEKQQELHNKLSQI